MSSTSSWCFAAVIVSVFAFQSILEAGSSWSTFETSGRQHSESDTGCGCYPGHATVLSGADVLLRDSLALLTGKTIGLICNRASVLADGTSLLDSMRRIHDFHLQAVFAPEHGVSGAYAAGERVPSTRSGDIRVHSLYGPLMKPTSSMLDGIDILVYDLQDVGARFYTYITTLQLCMEAAAERGIPIVVLDRPNPITGSMIEGPVLDTSMRSRVGCCPLPVRYGLTPGELARMIVGEGWIRSAKKLDLHVVTMIGWRRDMWFDETGMPWEAPSPNIRSQSAALVYAGMCLLEGTNISEGRGTSTPFEVVGAPFLSSAALASSLTMLALPGVRFDTCSFLPDSTAPVKYRGELCHGIRITVTDRDHFRPVLTGVQVLRVIRRLAGKRFATKNFLNMLGGIHEMGTLLSETIPDNTVTGALERGCADFSARRQRYFLYP